MGNDKSLTPSPESNDMVILRSLQESNNAVQKSNEAIVSLMHQMAGIAKETASIKRENENLKERLEKIETKHVHAENGDRWKVQGGIGHEMNPSIGSVHVGMLLCAVGLAKKIRDDNGATRVVPYSGHIGEDREARYYTTDTGRPHYQWHSERTFRHIDRWMKRMEYWEEYVGITDKKTMHSFIKRIYAAHNGGVVLYLREDNA